MLSELSSACVEGGRYTRPANYHSLGLEVQACLLAREGEE